MSPVSQEVVIDDPPAGLGLEPSDIIAGFIPVTSTAIQESVTFLVNLDGKRPRSCLATAPTDRTYAAQPAALAAVFDGTAIELEMPDSAPDLRFDSDLVIASGNTLCDRADEAGGAGGGEEDADAQGGGGAIEPLIDVDVPPFEVITWEDGPNFVHAGFHRLKIKYATSALNLGVELAGLSPRSATLFSGILLEATMLAYVDAHYEDHRQWERDLLTLRQDHVVFVGVFPLALPVHFAATGTLVAGVDLDAEVNLHAIAGAEAKFSAGIGVRYNGDELQNVSSFLNPPTLEELEDKRELNLSGSLAV